MIIQGGRLQGGRYQDQTQLPVPVLSLDAGNPASYPGSGSTWTDTIGGKIFTLYNNPAYDIGNGGAIVFDPASSQYAQGTGFVSTLTNWTVEAWLYHDATNMGGGSPCIVTQVYAGTPINFTLGNTQDAFPNVQSGSYNGGWAATDLGVTLTTGNWYQVVGAWDGTTASLYVNGALASSHAWPGFSSVSGNQDTRLMRRWDADQYWGGELAIVKIYDFDIGTSGVTASWNTNKGRFGL